MVLFLWPCVSTSRTHSILVVTLWSMCYSYSLSAKEETEAQRGQVICSVSQSEEVKEVGFEPKLAWLQSLTLLHKGHENTPVSWMPTMYEVHQLHYCHLSKMSLCDGQFYRLFSEKEIGAQSSKLSSQGHRATRWQSQDLNRGHLRLCSLWPCPARCCHQVTRAGTGLRRVRPWLWVQHLRGCQKTQASRSILF